MAQQTQNDVSPGYVQGFLASMPIDSLGVSRRIVYYLKRGGLATTLDVQRAWETGSLIIIKSVGKTTVVRVEQAMNALLADNGFNLTINELKLFTQSEPDAAPAPQAPAGILMMRYRDLPVDILADEVGADSMARLQAAQLKTVGEAVDFCPAAADFMQNVPAALAKLVAYHQKGLQEKLAAGKLHPQACYQDRSLGEWQYLAPEQENEQWALLFALAGVNKAASLNQELSFLIADCSEREKLVFFKQHHERERLDDTKERVGVTRERVRRIRLTAVQRIWKQIDRRPGVYFQTALLIWADQGEALSLAAWRQELLRRQVMDAEPVWQDVDALDTLCAILRSNPKRARALDLEMDAALLSLLNKRPGD